MDIKEFVPLIVTSASRKSWEDRVDRLFRKARMCIEYLLNGLSGGKFFKYQIDRDSRTGDDGFAHHHIRVGFYKIGVHDCVYYNIALVFSLTQFPTGARNEPLLTSLLLTRGL